MRFYISTSTLLEEEEHCIYASSIAEAQGIAERFFREKRSLITLKLTTPQEITHLECKRRVTNRHVVDSIVENDCYHCADGRYHKRFYELYVGGVMQFGVCEEHFEYFHS